MARQNTPFSEPGSERERLMPPGFRYQENVITEAEEAGLVDLLQKLDLKPFEFHGHLGNRRVVSFGLRYDYGRRTVEAASEFPSFLNELRAKVAEFAGHGVNEFRQAGVNEYRPGAGIGWHKDKAQFGIIVGVSLLAPARMRFRRAHGNGWARVSQTIAPRSIYVLSGEARTEWEHSLPPLDKLRYSLTFRTLSDKKRVSIQNRRQAESRSP
jgi:alkylated DNA repair dioxygenase AlkB